MSDTGKEVVVITFKAHTRTFKHKHKYGGASHVAKGEVVEIKPDGTINRYPKGSSFTEEAGSAHIVGNDTDEDAVLEAVYDGKQEMENVDYTKEELAALATFGGYTREPGT